VSSFPSKYYAFRRGGNTSPNLKVKRKKWGKKKGSPAICGPKNTKKRTEKAMRLAGLWAVGTTSGRRFPKEKEKRFD